jgi:group I intron endonuclease
MPHYIYKHTCSINGKSYIGQTINLTRREWFHRNTKCCIAFANAIHKHGWDNFSTIILHECDSYELANQLEVQAILDHNTMTPQGYNLRTGGQCGAPSDETRAKMSASGRRRVATDATKRKLSEVGKRLRSTPEYKKAQSERRLGIPHSEERKAKIKAARAHQIMQPRTDAQRQHQSDILKGIPRPTQQCIHCGLVTSTTNIKRWHNDNCKTIRESDPTS